MKIIFTGQSFAVAAKEIESVFRCAPAARLAPDAGIVDLPGTISEIHGRFLAEPILFTRHIFPAQIILPAGADPLSALEDISGRLDPARSYSVQAREAGGSNLTRTLSGALQSRGFSLDIRAPEQIVSVYGAADGLYLGVSGAKMNLSDWNGGMMHFSSQGLISRAECKVLEALRTFSIARNPGTQALDLGAAPGGWSRTLANLGLNVVAVDPAALDERVAKLAQVEHIAFTAQEFLSRDERRFHLIANDMKMDARDAVELLLRFRERLYPGGAILSTLKLPKKDAASIARACVSRIRKNADLTGARQLFHNRSEITVLFS